MSSGTLKKLVIRGTAWTVVGYGTSQGLRLASNLILTRLLVPELFGLMALVNVFIVGLNLFSDIGIHPSIIQNKLGDNPKFLNTAWTIQVIRGIGLWFACLLLAVPAANFYGETRLLWLLPVVGLNSVIHGFNSTSLASLSRQMKVGELVKLELGMQIVSLSILIIWAWLSPTIWALVGGNAIAALMELWCSHRLNVYTNNWFAWDRDAVKKIFSFGKWIFVSTAMTFLAVQSDRLILGKLFTLEMLGIYGIALTLSELLRSISQAISSKVIFPTFSKFADLPLEIYRTKLLKIYRPLIMTSACCLAILVSFGDILIANLYDERYAQATWMFPLLALGTWPGLLTQMTDPALIAIGKTKYMAIGYFLKFIFMIIGIPIGFHYGKELGTIIIIALNDVPFYIALKYGLWYEKLNTTSIILQEVLATFLLFSLITVMLVIRVKTGLGIPLGNLL